MLKAGGVRVGCSFPVPSAEKMILNYMIYSIAFGSIICVIINAGCLAKGKF